MVHRDLKPENILLDASLTVFLCDFGVSKVGMHPTAQRTDTLTLFFFTSL